MRICALFGSPHKKGNTAALLDRYSEGARAAGHEVEIFDVPRMDIGPCMGCMACKKKGACVQHDDMEKVYKSVKGADILVFASPMYWWNVTGPLKTAIDRLFALPFNIRQGGDALLGKGLQLIMTSGQPASSGLQSVLEHLGRNMCEFTGMRWLGIIAAGATGEHPAVGQNEALDEAWRAGVGLH